MMINEGSNPSSNYQCGRERNDIGVANLGITQVEVRLDSFWNQWGEREPGKKCDKIANCS
jgi:hypothetical protein